MKKTIKLAVVAALALGTTSAFATNGDTMIALGAKSSGMAGTGIGMSHGAESALVNPALISSVSGSEISFGGTVFMPKVSTDMGVGGGSLDSAANMNVIPEVSLATKVNENFSWGIGMWGTAGMGTDYRNKLDNFNGTAVKNSANNNSNAAYMATMTATSGDTVASAAAAQQAAQGTIFGALGQGNFAMVTNLQLMQFAVPLAYSNSGLTVAVSPILQYGSLDINYNVAEVHMNDAGNAITSVSLKSGSTQGVAQDFGFGYNVGLSYETSGLKVGAMYKSKIDMEYKGQISKAITDFTQGMMTMSDHLEQPAEMGVGVSYKMGESTIAADYKKIAWSDAKGYKDFGWEDQSVYSIGYEYATSDWAARLGYNHADSCITESANTTLNTLNLLGFPAIIESHIAVGGTYNVSKRTSIDLAYVYGFSTSEKYANMLQSTTETKHSQNAVSAQLTYKF